MKVKELINALENMDEESEVQFSYNYGDHWRTQVASKIRDVEEEQVEWSDYHCMNRVLDEDDDREMECRDPAKPITTLVVIS